MTETLILPVPDRLRANFVVVAPHTSPPGLRLASDQEASPEPPTLWAPSIRQRPMTAQPMPGLLHALTCGSCAVLDQGTRQKIAASETFIEITCVGTASWPPLHIWAGALSTTAYALATGGIPLDPQTAAPVSARVWLRLLYGTPDDFTVGHWVRFTTSSRRERRRLRTTGLYRFGVPELEVRGLPANLVDPWMFIMQGIARRLLLEQWKSLEKQPDAAFREIPAIVAVTLADAGHAAGIEPADRDQSVSADVRLRLEPGTPALPSVIRILSPGTTTSDDGHGGDGDDHCALEWAQTTAHRLAVNHLHISRRQGH